MWRMWFILLAWFLSACNDTFSEIEQSERHIDYNALEALYIATDGDNWVNNTNWCSDTPLEEWYGVYTYQGRVYAIDLFNNNLTGTLPEEISQLTELKSLNLASNSIKGSIPECYGKLKKLSQLALYNNLMSGQIPSSLNCIDGWHYTWGYTVLNNRYNRFNLYNCGITAPELNLTLLSGENFTLNREEYAHNTYTILFQWSADKLDFIKTLQPIYNKYKEYGLEIISWAAESDKVATTVEQYGIDWKVATVSEDNPLSQHNAIYYPVGLYPTVTMFDNEGNLVFSDCVESRGNIVSVVDTLFAQIIRPDLYYSTDFSKDGDVLQLQKATEGAGIDIILMADGFTDRMVDDGRYMEVMRRTTDIIFSQEPFKHFRELFNVYAITAVSLNEIYASGAQTALSCYFGEGTLVGGDDEKCFEYAQRVVSKEQLNQTLIVVVINSNKYAGTSYMYFPEYGDYGSGAAIAYIPLTESQELFTALVLHEACGHGFAKLDDEYTLEGMGTIPAEQKKAREIREKYGWLRNTDIYHSPNFVKWSALLSDYRYRAQGLGVFEGASSYAYGVYKPTEESIMNKNTGGFNAPSREAIYYRIHKLSYGSEWVYDLNEFKKYDFLNNHLPKISSCSYTTDNKVFEPCVAPIIINKRW